MHIFPWKLTERRMCPGQGSIPEFPGLMPSKNILVTWQFNHGQVTTVEYIAE